MNFKFTLIFVFNCNDFCYKVKILEYFLRKVAGQASLWGADRHSRERGNPEIWTTTQIPDPWIPAFSGMTATK